MKITDVTSGTSSGKSSIKKDAVNEDTTTNRKRSLLERFNIPIEHLDFQYIKNSCDSREVERILRILRSGEEGSFPDLEHCVAEKLAELNPRSRLLRVETPVLRSEELDAVEKEAIEEGLLEWLSEFSLSSEGKLGGRNSEIFGEDESSIDDELNEMFPLPIRGSRVVVGDQAITLNKSESNGRIKSWEYDKWDKFDVDAELTKLDITDMQRDEWERIERPKIMEEQKQTEKLMKEDNVLANIAKKNTNLKDPIKVSDSKRELIENKGRKQSFNDSTGEEGVKVKFSHKKALSTSGQKTKIIIDDLHMPV